ncbi:zinc-binding dehydrogenase [Cryobacterium sp. Y50]|uniref:zinc-dependent alcohol dehydrogenase n=1 Tax=Cryobacterium sp. Y50 TaxID=2048286 RepID=UPI001304CC56|nr:zinc-binding dehydrogenase [Cryobacterium sp. Y50]
MQAAQLVAPSLITNVTVTPPDGSSLVNGEVLVRVAAASICGSDVPHFRRGGQTADSIPAAVGYPLHEIMGDVVATRSGDFEVGQRVVGWASEMNGLAELVITSAEQLALCDVELPPWEAVIAQPLACVLFAASRLGNVAGKDVAVIGLGAIGLMLCHVLKRAGARSVTGVDPINRVELKSSFGINHLVHASSTEWVQNIDERSRADVVIEAVGHQIATLRDAIDATAVGGIVYCFGIPALTAYPIDLTTVVRNNLTVSGGVTLNHRRYLREACGYLAANPLLARALVTHILPMHEAQRAYDLASSPAPGRLKVVLVPTTSELDERGSNE